MHYQTTGQTTRINKIPRITIKRVGCFVILKSIAGIGFDRKIYAKYITIHSHARQRYFPSDYNFDADLPATSSIQFLH